MVSWTETISKWVKQREVKFAIHPVRFPEDIQLHVLSDIKSNFHCS